MLTLEGTMYSPEIPSSISHVADPVERLLTSTSAFLLTLRLECALTSFLIVDRGYALLTAMVAHKSSSPFLIRCRLERFLKLRLS